MEKNWVRPVSPEGAGEFLCIATYLPVRRWRHIIPFVRLSFRIEKQLKKSPGLMRYGLHTNLPRKQFWTLSVWADRQEMNNFVSREPHTAAVKKFDQWAGTGAAFAEWESQNASFPWAKALEELTHPKFYHESSGK
ncbi:MAG: antibiotic biosynthesis monooxygenase [Terriglobia bacterium]